MIGARYEIPYPRGLKSFADIERYLKSLHSSLIGYQSYLEQAIETRLAAYSSDMEVGWTDIPSDPETGEHRVKDLRLDSTKSGFVVKWDDTPVGSATVYPQIASAPGAGEYKIVALRLDANKALTILYDETAAAASGVIRSNPKSGEYRITGIRLDSTKTKLVVAYDETAE